ncbi:hypothetical protein ACFW04_001600 [Cataglyphis niger]
MNEVNESINISNKICYKCAYELGQCTEFVQKYKKSHKTSKPESKTSMPYCCLCFEHVENNRIFDITKDNRTIFNPLQKIRKIFNECIKDDNDCKLICLACRYNLDVLYDLRRIYQEAVIHLKGLINEEIDYSNFPKVYTDVVNRKTTVTTFPDITLYDLINSDSENSEKMARNKSRVKNRRGRPNAQTKLQNDVKPNVRKCDECHNIVPKGTDMYRFHCTRLTVCRNCWITMDPSKDKLKRRSRQIDTSNLAETKLCAVFLTDVLDKKSNKNEKEHKYEKNKENKSYIMSEDSSLEDRLSELNNALNNNIKRGKKRQIDSEKEDNESTPTKIAKLGTKRENANETKISSDVEQQSTTYSTRRGHKRTNSANDQSSDSDVSSPVGSRKKLDDRAKLSSPSSSKLDRKKLKTILQGVTANVQSQSIEESSIEDTNLEKTMENVSNKHTNKEKNAHKRTRSSSVSSTETASLAEFKSPKSVVLSEVKKNCHTCDTCGKKFDTKLENVKHGLTHFMQASLKLERVNIAKEKQELKIDLEEDKTFKETKVFLTKPESLDKHTDDSSEEIAINIEDTDEEEIFSLSREQSTKKEEAKKEISSEDYNVTHKLDAESKLHVEESAKIQSDEKMVEESEQCVELTAVPNETEISIEIEQEKDTKETNTKNNNIRENDTKDKDRKASMDRDIDTLIDKDTNVQKDAIVKDMFSTSKFSYCDKLCTNVDVDENKDVTENDTKMPTKEKEKSNNETNNDKEHLHEEITHDSKVTRSLVLSINNTIKDDNNKNHNENCKSDLKNICEDNESELIKDVEMTQCELIHDNKSENENIDESEKTVLDIIDETEKLNDQIDLNDTVVMDEDKIEVSEKQQDTTNDQNMETEVIIDDDKSNDDKSNDATDTAKSDFLNGEKLNQAENSDETENDIVIIPADSNKDIIQYTKDTEKTITIDSSKEKDKLEETIKNLEDLIENNKTNNKYEEQENSNHTLNDSPIDAANMILKEVFDLAAAEVEKREDINNIKDLQDTEIETLENITREIRNSADMPSLDPISIMDIDDDNDITLN